MACRMPPRGVSALTGLRHLSPMSTWLSLPASRHHSAQALPSTHLLPGRYAQQPLTPHASRPSAFSPTPCLPFIQTAWSAYCTWARCLYWEHQHPRAHPQPSCSPHPAHLAQPPHPVTFLLVTFSGTSSVPCSSPHSPWGPRVSTCTRGDGTQVLSPGPLWADYLGVTP